MTIEGIIISLIVSLTETIFFEVLISRIMGIKDSRDIKIIILANLITNPCVVYIANALFLAGNFQILNVAVIIMEILVVIVEGLIFKKYLKFDKISPLKISLINNILSFTIGNIMNII